MAVTFVKKLEDRRHPFEVDIVELAEGFFDIFVYLLCVHFIPTFKRGMKEGFARKAKGIEFRLGEESLRHRRSLFFFTVRTSNGKNKT